MDNIDAINLDNAKSRSFAQVNTNHLGIDMREPFMFRPTLTQTETSPAYSAGQLSFNPTYMPSTLATDNAWPPQSNPGDTGLFATSLLLQEEQLLLEIQQFMVQLEQLIAQEIQAAAGPQDTGAAPSNNGDAPASASTPTDSTSSNIPTTDSNNPGDSKTIAQLTAISEAGLAPGTMPSWWSQQHQDLVKQASKQDSQLEFFGDSITQRLNNDPANLGVFKTRFGQYNPEAFGIGGDGTKQLLYRLNHGEFQGHPKVAVVMIGTNDLSKRSAADIEKDIPDIVQSIQARSPETKVLLMGILPRNFDQSKISDINNYMSTLDNGSSVRFANIDSQFTDASGNPRTDLLPDQIHPDQKGYQVWSDAISPLLNSMLTAPTPAITAPTDTGSSSSASSSASSPPTQASGDNTGDLPSWANLTAVKNNYDSPVSPSFFAQRISANARYTDVNLPAPKNIDYDEGIMIDTRGMKPEDLRTVKVYESTNDWVLNNTDGKYLGTIQVPKNLEFPRPATDYHNGIVVNTNNPLTIIQPDGTDFSFNKVDLEGDTMIANKAGAHGGSYIGNEGALTLNEARAAIESGAAPKHSLNIDLNISDAAKEFPAGLANDKPGSPVPNLKMGMLLAIPPGVTAEQLGLQTNLGKAMFKTMQEYGGYAVDSSGYPADLINTEVGTANLIKQSGQKDEFTSDFKKIMAATKMVTG
jgi:lysophospholipase L1-like esterase